jgi:hypothetical protein
VADYSAQATACSVGFTSVGWAGYTYSRYNGGGEFDQLLASIARFEAIYGDDLSCVWDNKIQAEALAYKSEFNQNLSSFNIGSASNLNRAALTTAVTIENNASISVPEEIERIFRESFREHPRIGDSWTGYQAYMIAPAQKFSFNPPQLHTMPDLPIEEWYNFDWIGMIDAALRRWDEDPASSSILFKPFADSLRLVRERLAEILPPNPSPKNAQEALFWKEMQELGVFPEHYYNAVISWEYTKRAAELYAVFGVDYYQAVKDGLLALLEKVNAEHPDEFRILFENMNAIRDIGVGYHWQDPNPSEIYPNEYTRLVDGIRDDPNYEKAFDETIPYDEREAIRMELDRLMRKRLDDQWNALAKQMKNQFALQNGLKNLLDTVGQ